MRVVLTDEAYDAIAFTLPKGAARWPMQRDWGQCFIQVEAAVVDRIRALHGPGESWNDVILRVAAEGATHFCGRDLLLAGHSGTELAP